MLKIRCFKCGWAWSMNAAAIQTALETLEPGAKHYIAECPRCRRVNKVSVKQMRRVLGRAPEAEKPVAEEPASEKPTVENPEEEEKE
jgi:hypothetical protein